MARNGNYDSARMSTLSRETLLEELSEECFFVAHPEHKSPLSYLRNMIRHGALAQTQTQGVPEVIENMNKTSTWEQRFAIFLMQLLRFLSTPMALVGWLLELAGNIVIANGGLLRTIFRGFSSLFALFLFKEGPLVIPDQESASYLSLIGMIDPRRTLLPMDTTGSPTSSSLTAESAESVDGIAKLAIFPGPGNGDRRIGDVMLMAAKFAYENKAVVKDVVTNEWKMNFVDMYNCWNEYQQKSNDQVFVFTDKATDANAVVVAWRGTEPFNGYDWSTDVDFSWYDLQDNAGKVHIGFLEALGLGDRHDMETFSRVRRNADIKRQRPSSLATAPRMTRAASGLSRDVIKDKILAYDHVSKVVKKLLAENPNAKLFITGHSLGGALALLYAGMLYYFGELAVADRIAAVYSIGQPRVGDEHFANFMLEKLSVQRYFRVVYCNDLVPRIPFDDALFKFKHWGLCYYFDSMYEQQTLKEEPDENYFNASVKSFINIHFNAVMELLNSLYVTHKFGPEYRESWASLLFRVFALFLPGMGAHSPVNYMNAVRLGKPMPLVAKLYEEAIEKNV